MYQRRPPATSAPIAGAPAVDPWESPLVAPDLADHVGATGDPTALLPWIDDLSIGSGGSTRDELPATTHTAAPARTADSGPQIPRGLRYDPNWTQMALGTFREENAPDQVRLPDAVVRGLDEAQRRMNTDPHRNKEHGGNLVRRYGGDFDVRHGGESGGDEFEFSPDRKNVGVGQDFVGTFHTHSLERGQSDDTFSDDDIANFTDDDRRVSMVRAGANTHMLARTKEFDAMLQKVENDKDTESLVERRNEFHNNMKLAYNAVYNERLAKNPQDRAGALEAATQAVAKQYHLLYYSGQGANMKRAGGPAPKK